MADDNVISEEQFTIIMVFYACVASLISTLGMVSNTVNIRIFLSIGLAEGVTISFFVLSLSDFVFLVARLLRAVTAGFMAIETISDFRTWFPVDPYALHFYFAHVGHIVYTYTILITTFLAVARCMCVVKPLKFKYIFTKELSILVLVTCFVSCVVCFSPIFAYMGITTQYDQRINSSRPMLLIAPQRELVKRVTWSLRDVGFAVPSQVVVVICVIVKTKRLIAASKFRNRSKQGSLSYISVVQLLHSSVESALHEGSVLREASLSRDARVSSHRLGSKDLHAVQQVVLISVVFITCNTPKIIMTIAGLLEPGLTLDGQFQNIYLSMNWLTDIFQTINASVGIFIYYKYNSKFRNILSPNRIADTNSTNQRSLY